MRCSLFGKSAADIDVAVRESATGDVAARIRKHEQVSAIRSSATTDEAGSRIAERTVSRSRGPTPCATISIAHGLDGSIIQARAWARASRKRTARTARG